MTGDTTTQPSPSLGRALGRLLRLEWALVGAAALAATVAAALALVPFFAVAEMATALFGTPPDLAALRPLAWWTGGALLLRYALVACANMCAHVAAFRILHTLRMRLAAKLGEVPLSFFNERSTGALKRTFMDDVNQVEAFVAHHFPDAVAAAVVPLATAIALLWVDWRMALASLVMAPVAGVTMAALMRGSAGAHQEWGAIQRRTDAALIEYLQGIHVIKTFGLTARRFGEVARAIDEGIGWMERFMRSNGRGFGAFGALIGSSLLILLPLGGALSLSGTLSLSALLLFLVLGPQLLMSFMRLMFAVGNLDRIRDGLERIQGVLDSPELRQAPRGTSPEGDGLSFQDVSFRYEEAGREVLHDISFEARPGTITALVGPSGAGKSTLLRLIPRLWEPTSGRVALGGVDLRALPLDVLLSRISMVFQDVVLFHGTVRENLLLARQDATPEQLEAACRAARAHDFIMALPKGYDTLLGERGARLSGGEKQRLSIARALLKDAPVLLLDEATAFADPQNEARIQEALSTLCAERTVIVVAHRLSTVSTADHLVVLEEGRVVDQGGHDALLERCPLYQRLWKDHTASLDWTLGLGPAEAEVVA